jgi:hypothetical protein
MASRTEICNLALSHLGNANEIGNLETEKSAEASACRRFYDTTRDQTLRDFSWPFATKIASLALIESDPNSEWDYAYGYPSDCLLIRRILSGISPDTSATRVPYRVANGTSGLYIFTDKEDAEIEYTIRVDDPTLYPPDFVMAFSLRLAHFIAPRVTGADEYKLGDRALKLYAMEISTAQMSAVGEEQAYLPPESEFITVRG